MTRKRDVRPDQWREKDFTCILTSRSDAETIQSLKTRVKQMLDYLAKNITRNAYDGCRIEIVVSDINGATGKKVRPHCHFSD